MLLKALHFAGEDIVVFEWPQGFTAWEMPELDLEVLGRERKANLVEVHGSANRLNEHVRSSQFRT